MSTFSKLRFSKFILVVSIFSFLFISGCNNSLETDGEVQTPEPSAVEEEISSKPSDPTPVATVQPSPTIDLEAVKPNEAGKIMIVMFHNFVESFTPTSYDNGEYTTTFSDFKKLLQELYDKDYRLISMTDYLNNNISIPAGCIPMVFTFDDGTSGQFNLVEENGVLEANKRSAVGIMEEFNKTHPDFGLQGTFYVNLGNGTFEGEGSLKDRLEYLVDQGFEIGNHTYNHVNLVEVTSASEIQKQIGMNQKTISEFISGYEMSTFSLPYGSPAKALQEYVRKGAYEGVNYNNLAIMEVGWCPDFAAICKEFDPFSVYRVRSSGINPVDCDLEWWLGNLSRAEQYVSDGNPDTITIPKSREDSLDKERLKGRELIIYDD